MSAVQGWVFLAVLLGLGARAHGGVRVGASELRWAAFSVAVAMLQVLTLGQVALDDPWCSPLLLALPIVAAREGDARRAIGATAAAWIALVVVAGSAPSDAAGELAQGPYLTATVFSLLLAGVAAAVPTVRALGPLLGLAWMVFFLQRDASLLLAPSVWAVVVLSVGWCALASAAPVARWLP